MYIRLASNRRNARPFGTNMPWLTTGKMGGLIFTDRRKTDRRSTDNAMSISQIAGVELCYP